MSDKYKCPDCGEDLEAAIACGSESYFCYTCKSLKSRKRIKGHSHYIEPDYEGVDDEKEV